MEQLGLQDAKDVSTHAVDVPASCGGEAQGAAQEEEELPPSDATQFRGTAARCNYLQLDRPDIQYAAKACCQLMSRPAPYAQELFFACRYVLERSSDIGLEI